MCVWLVVSEASANSSTGQGDEDDDTRPSNRCSRITTTTTLAAARLARANQSRRTQIRERDLSHCQLVVELFLVVTVFVSRTLSLVSLIYLDRDASLVCALPSATSLLMALLREK